MTGHRQRGVLIAFEGIDGSGKSTQAELLVARLRRAGFEVVSTREPTEGPHGRRLRESATRGRLPPEEELEAFVADREQHVRNVIAPALRAGMVVVVDRYYYSTAAYQGARGLDWRAIVARNEAFAPRPDLVVHLTVDLEDATRRIVDRDRRTNLFEAREQLAGVARIFDAIEGSHVMRVDGALDPDAVHAEILRRVDPLLESRLGRSMESS